MKTHDKYFDILDSEGSIMKRHYSGRARTLVEAELLINRLNKHGEYSPYTIVPAQTYALDVTLRNSNESYEEFIVRAKLEGLGKYININK